MPNTQDKARKDAWKDPSLDSDRESDARYARRPSDHDVEPPLPRARSQADVEEEREKEHEEEDVEREDAEGGAP